MTAQKNKRNKNLSTTTSSTVLEVVSGSHGRLELWLTVGLLAAVGLIYSITFYGHFIYFNSDFWSFLGEGR